jgi:hypothetical protein
MGALKGLRSACPPRTPPHSVESTRRGKREAGSRQLLEHRDREALAMQQPHVLLRYPVEPGSSGEPVHLVGRAQPHATFEDEQAVVPRPADGRALPAILVTTPHRPSTAIHPAIRANNAAGSAPPSFGRGRQDQRAAGSLTRELTGPHARGVARSATAASPIDRTQARRGAASGARPDPGCRTPTDHGGASRQS